MAVGKELEFEGMFEPLTAEEEIIGSLANNDAAGAAKMLRALESAKRDLLTAFGDMIDGDPKTDPELMQRYRYRLKIVSWGLPGRKPKGHVAAAIALATESNPPEAELAVFEALANGDAAAAAKQLRVLENAGEFLLGVFADLLDGDAMLDPTLAVRYPRCLKVVPWGLAGRRGRNYHAIGETSRYFTAKRGTTPSDAYLAERVEKLRRKGHSVAQAIKFVADMPDRFTLYRCPVDQRTTDQLTRYQRPEYQQLSESAVRNAYYRYRRKIFRRNALLVQYGK